MKKKGEGCLIDLNLVEKVYKKSVDLRRNIHENPELGMETHETMRTVKKYADELSIPSKEIENGLIVDIGQNPSVALRADMDALPVEENTGLPFSSKIKGRMHACGHDVHTATLVGVMEYCTEAGISGVRFIFQPGEEIGKGARMMIDGGAMDGIRAIFGLHVWPALDVGEYSIIKGTAMAAVDEFKIKVKGNGGHAAYPHLVFDTILESSRIIQNLISIPARKINPLNPSVVSVGYVNGGKATNVIPASVEIGGTVRTHLKSDSIIIEKEIRKMESEHIQIDYCNELPPLINDSDLAESIDSTASSYLKMVNAQPSMGGEDFALYCEKGQCAFAFLGTGKINGLEVSKHSNIFNVNEESIKYGIMLHLSAIEAMKEGR